MCRLLTETIGFLGLDIRPECPEIASHMTDAIRELQAPTFLTIQGSFLGLRNVFKRVVPNLARISALSNQKICKEHPSTVETLNEEEMISMTTLNDVLTLQPLLALPNSAGYTTLTTDAFDVMAGCLILQQQPKKTTRLFGYCSGSVTRTDRKLKTTQMERLAIVWSVSVLPPYL